MGYGGINPVRQVYTPQEKYLQQISDPNAPQVYGRKGLLDIAPNMAGTLFEPFNFEAMNLAYRLPVGTVPSYFSGDYDISDMSLLGGFSGAPGGDYKATNVTPDYLQRMAEEEAAREEEKRRQQQAAQQSRRLTPQQEYYYQILDPQSEAERRVNPQDSRLKWTWEGGSKYIDDYGNVAVLSEGGD